MMVLFKAMKSGRPGTRVIFGAVAHQMLYFRKTHYRVEHDKMVEHHVGGSFRANVLAWPLCFGEIIPLS